MTLDVDPPVRGHPARAGVLRAGLFPGLRELLPRFSALSASATSADGSVILSDDLSDLKFE
jgi:hypothetical protein